MAEQLVAIINGTSKISSATHKESPRAILAHIGQRFNEQILLPVGMSLCLLSK